MINNEKLMNLWRSFVFLILILAISVTSASAYGAALKVDIIKYEPSPAEIGQYVTVWVKIENVGYERANDVSIELDPLYPFSLDSTENAVKNIGILSTENGALYEYQLFVDENAKPGTRSIKVRYQTDESIAWSEEEFDIRVGSDTFDSKGTIQLQQIKTEPEVFLPGDEGTVTTFTVIRTASEHFERITPYVLGIVQLDEGPKLTAQIVCTPEEVRIGMRVRGVFRRIAADGESGVIHYGTKFIPVPEN